MTSAELLVERERRLQRWREGFAHGADPKASRRRIDAEVAGDPAWRAGMKVAQDLAREAEDDYAIYTLSVDLAVLRYPERYKDHKPDYTVVDVHGRLVRHLFEEPRDAPGQDTCWFCLCDRKDRIHK